MRATRRFVTYLELLQPRVGETADEIDVRVEVETEDDEDEERGRDRGDRLRGRGRRDRRGRRRIGRPARTTEPGAARRRRVTIPDDPTILSYLLSGILQVESPRRQALLEAPTSEARLRELLRIIDREILLLERRLRLFRPDARLLGLAPQLIQRRPGSAPGGPRRDGPLRRPPSSSVHPACRRPAIRAVGPRPSA